MSSTTANAVFTIGLHTCNTLVNHSHLQTCISMSLIVIKFSKKTKLWLKALWKRPKMKNAINCLYKSICLFHLSALTIWSPDVVWFSCPWQSVRRAIVCTAWYQVPQLRSYKWSRQNNKTPVSCLMRKCLCATCLFSTIIKIIVIPIFLVNYHQPLVSTLQIVKLYNGILKVTLNYGGNSSLI